MLCEDYEELEEYCEELQELLHSHECIARSAQVQSSQIGPGGVLQHMQHDLARQLESLSSTLHNSKLSDAYEAPANVVSANSQVSD